jgi:DNA-binding CsgD family transcriptional regulator
VDDSAQHVLSELLPERLARLRQVTGLPVVLGGAIGQDRLLVLDRLMGTVGDAMRGLVVEPGKGLGGSVVHRRTPLRVNDYVSTTAITHEYDQAARAERFTSVFAVPVLVWGEVRGVLYGAVRDRRLISDGTVRSAVVVADQLRHDVEIRFRQGSALAELAAVIRDTEDPQLRARLIRIQQGLSGRPVPPKAGLSPREVDTLRLVEVGASNLEIAAELGLSLETVKAYLRSAMRKLGVHNRTAAAHQTRLKGLF